MKYIRAMTTAFLLLLLATPPAFAQGAGNEQQPHNQKDTELGRTDEYDRAVVVARKALAEVEKNVGPDHPEVATSLINLGSLYDNQGKYALAESVYKRALAIREKALGPDHPQVATDLNYLGMLYYNQGKYALAEPIHKRALAIDEKALTPDDPDLAIDLNNLALLYDTQGKYALAEPLHKRALAIDEKALGPDHPDLATDLTNLGLLYDAQGKYALAEPLYKRALAIGEKALGPDHPRVVQSLKKLAMLYYTQGKHALAESLYKRALAIDEKALGPDHPEVATDLNYLGLLYHTQGKYALAEPLYTRALAIRDKALRPDDPHVTQSLSNLAMLYCTQGKHALAEPLCKRVLDIREEALGPDHPDLAIDLSNLGFVYDTQGKYALAEPLYKRALAIEEKALGPDHPQVVQSMKELAMLYCTQGKHAQAEPLYARIAAAFSPPDAQQRRDAVGAVEGLSETMRRALEPAGHFKPIPKPDPLRKDWLVMHDEPGQTFGQFVESKPNKPTGERRKIYLQPLGDFAETAGPLLERLREFTSAFFAMPVEVSEPIDLEGAQITSRINPYTQKTQLLTDDLLELLKQRLPEDAFCVVGVTMTDLYPDPAWNFVFGTSSFSERVGVYSFARYDPRFYGEKAPDDVEAIVLRRSCKMLATGTAYMFGIQHCVFFSCLMNGVNHMLEFDQSPAHLCPIDLRKLQHSIGFDVVNHYRKLRAFWHEAGWAEETKWLTDRLRHVEQGFAESTVAPD